jgi:bifunctional DNase/RNase
VYLKIEKLKLSIYDIVLSENGFVVILRKEDYYQEKALLITVGFAEAQLLTVQFNKVPTTRPLIIDIINNLFTLLKLDVKEIFIHEFSEGIFHSQIFLEGKENEKFLLDAKTSDALIFALNFNAPIYVNQILFDSKAIDFSFTEEEEIVMNNKEGNLKLLEKDLKLAIQEERYEEAALLRDKIKKILGELSD